MPISWILPIAHALNQSQLSLLSTLNVAAGMRSYNVQILQGLGFAIVRRDPNDEEALDAVFYAASALELDISAIFGALAVAVNAGFVHGVAPSGSVKAEGLAVIRAALVWAHGFVSSCSSSVALGGGLLGVALLSFALFHIASASHSPVFARHRLAWHRLAGHCFCFTRCRQAGVVFFDVALIVIASTSHAALPCLVAQLLGVDLPGLCVSGDALSSDRALRGVT